MIIFFAVFFVLFVAWYNIERTFSNNKEDRTKISACAKERKKKRNKTSNKCVKYKGAFTYKHSNTVYDLSIESFVPWLYLLCLYVFVEYIQ